MIQPTAPTTHWSPQTKFITAAAVVTLIPLLTYAIYRYWPKSPPPIEPKKFTPIKYTHLLSKKQLHHISLIHQISKWKFITTRHPEAPKIEKELLTPNESEETTPPETSPPPSTPLPPQEEPLEINSTPQLDEPSSPVLNESEETILPDANSPPPTSLPPLEEPLEISSTPQLDEPLSPVLNKSEETVLPDTNSPPPTPLPPQEEPLEINSTPQLDEPLLPVLNESEETTLPDINSPPPTSLPPLEEPLKISSTSQLDEPSSPVLNKSEETTLPDTNSPPPTPLPPLDEPLEISSTPQLDEPSSPVLNKSEETILPEITPTSLTPLPLEPNEKERTSEEIYLEQLRSLPLPPLPELRIRRTRPLFPLPPLPTEQVEFEEREPTVKSSSLPLPPLPHIEEAKSLSVVADKCEETVLPPAAKPIPPEVLKRREEKERKSNTFWAFVKTLPVSLYYDKNEIALDEFRDYAMGKRELDAAVKAQFKERLAALRPKVIAIPNIQTPKYVPKAIEKPFEIPFQVKLAIESKSESKLISALESYQWLYPNLNFGNPVQTQFQLKVAKHLLNKSGAPLDTFDLKPIPPYLNDYLAIPIGDVVVIGDGKWAIVHLQNKRIRTPLSSYDEKTIISFYGKDSCYFVGATEPLLGHLYRGEKQKTRLKNNAWVIQDKKSSGKQRCDTPDRKITAAVDRQVAIHVAYQISKEIRNGNQIDMEIFELYFDALQSSDIAKMEGSYTEDPLYQIATSLFKESLTIKNPPT